eukprot:6217959-Alexandrium_andersonii.AAC.1
MEFKERSFSAEGNRARVLSKLLYCIGALLFTPSETRALEARHLSYARRILVSQLHGAASSTAQPRRAIPRSWIRPKCPP